MREHVPAGWSVVGQPGWFMRAGDESRVMEDAAEGQGLHVGGDEEWGWRWDGVMECWESLE